MGFSDKVNESGKTINAILVIGFIGIVWLIIYGNLSGNLGFEQDTLSVTNDTPFTLVSSGNAPATTSGLGHPTLSNIVVTNGTADGGAQVLTSGNWTISGATIYATNNSVFNDTLVNISYDVAFDSREILNTDGVIKNLTEGVDTFFSFGPVWFTILAIVLLIVILVGLLVIVMKIANIGKGKSGDGGRSDNNQEKRFVTY